MMSALELDSYHLTPNPFYLETTSSSILTEENVYSAEADPPTDVATDAAKGIFKNSLGQHSHRGLPRPHYDYEFQDMYGMVEAHHHPSPQQMASLEQHRRPQDLVTPQSICI